MGTVLVMGRDLANILLYSLKFFFRTMSLSLFFNPYAFLLQESEPSPCYRVKIDFSLSDDDDIYLPNTQPITWHFHTPEEEIR